MPIKKRRRGSGITERVELHIDVSSTSIGDDELAEIEARFTQDATFEGYYGKPIEEKALNILKDAGFTYDRGQLLIDGRDTIMGRVINGVAENNCDYLEDKEVHRSWRILKEIGNARREIESNNADQAARCAFNVGAIAATSSMKFRWEPLILAFIEGPRRSRRDALTKQIDKALKKLGRKASARDVLQDINQPQGDVVLNVDDDDSIEWKRPGGKVEVTTFKSFQNRLSKRRKKFSD